MTTARKPALARGRTSAVSGLSPDGVASRIGQPRVIAAAGLGSGERGVIKLDARVIAVSTRPWLTPGQRPTQRLPRLIRDARLCYGLRDTGNAIIQGDNLAVLSALKSDFTGLVRCIYIDPPYNNQENYTHYEDTLSHDEWLQEIIPRIELLWGLLRPDGSLWISIDDGECTI